MTDDLPRARTDRRLFIGGLGASAAVLAGCAGVGAGSGSERRASPTPDPVPDSAPSPAPDEVFGSIPSVRTPAARFEGLPDYDYAPRYAEDLPGYEGLRMHYVDVGPRDAEHTYLCLHGQPSWSYLYRHMIPVFEASGGRVVAPDWFGMGRSDKPIDDAAYSFEFHRNAGLALLERLDLTNVTLVCQDWGGLIGLTLPPAMPDRFARAIIMNTGLLDRSILTPRFAQWQARARAGLDVPRFFARMVPSLSAAEAAAYGAPFPSPLYQAAVRTFPSLIPSGAPTAADALAEAARAWWSDEWTGQSFIASGTADPVFDPARMATVRSYVRGAPPLYSVPGGVHFIQEDHGAEIAEAALRRFETR